MIGGPLLPVGERSPRGVTIIIGLLLVILAGCGGWSKKDTVMELGFAAATTVDWHQTEAITYNCAETNPVLGRCGERMPVDAFMPIAMVAHAAISAVIPPRWRTIWQALGIGAEVSTDFENYENRYWIPPTVVEGGMPVPYARP